jgi:hypothetical protein
MCDAVYILHCIIFWKCWLCTGYFWEDITETFSKTFSYANYHLSKCRPEIQIDPPIGPLKQKFDVWMDFNCLAKSTDNVVFLFAVFILYLLLLLSCTSHAMVIRCIKLHVLPPIGSWGTISNDTSHYMFEWWGTTWNSCYPLNSASIFYHDKLMPSLPLWIHFGRTDLYYYNNANGSAYHLIHSIQC